MTRDEALAALRRPAATIHEPTADQAVARLLERISGHADAEALRDALVELGARALLEARE